MQVNKQALTCFDCLFDQVSQRKLKQKVKHKCIRSREKHGPSSRGPARPGFFKFRTGRARPENKFNFPARNGPAKNEKFCLAIYENSIKNPRIFTKSLKNQRKFVNSRINNRKGTRILWFSSFKVK